MENLSHRWNQGRGIFLLASRGPRTSLTLSPLKAHCSGGALGAALLSVCLSLPWGPRAGEEVPHLVVPRAWRGVRGSVSGGQGPLSVAQAAPPLPLPPPQTLLMKSSWPRGRGREAGGRGGRGKEGGGGLGGGWAVAPARSSRALALAPPGGSTPACVRRNW